MKVIRLTTPCALPPFVSGPRNPVSPMQIDLATATGSWFRSLPDGGTTTGCSEHHVVTSCRQKSKVSAAISQGFWWVMRALARRRRACHFSSALFSKTARRDDSRRSRSTARIIGQQ